jgi:glycosyltransferase domain-containing protein
MVPPVTVIIMSYERQPYLRRQLLYFAEKPVHLIIADASDEAWSLGNAGGSGEMSYEYFHVPGYNTFIERLHLALERVNTEFMCFIDDEECLLWMGIMEAIRHLSENPDQVCAGGMVAETVETTGGLSLRPWGRWATSWSLKNDSPLDRFSEMVKMERTANLYYQVHRTAVIRKYVDCLRDFQYSYRGAFELAMSGFVILSGKWEMGTYPFWIRNGGSITPPSSATNYMTKSDTAEVVRVLMGSRSSCLSDSVDLDPSGPKYTPEFFEALIESGWGVDGLSDNRVHNKSLISRTVHVLRVRIGRMLRSHAPELHSRLRNRRQAHFSTAGNIDIYESTTFSDYGNAFEEAIPGFKADLECIERIWKSFPDGVPV